MWYEPSVPLPSPKNEHENNCRTKRFVLDESDYSRARQGDQMVDLQSVEIELRNARKARINAELACCDVEELAAEIRQSRYAFIRLMAERGGFRLH